MNCDPLANTGVGTTVVLVLILAITLLIAGAALSLAARRRRPAVRGTLFAMVVLAIVIAFTPAPPALAAPADCASADNSLTVTQTSTMEGLAPGAPAAAITGLVRNNGTDATRIMAVRVEITSVTTGPQALAGACSARDYILFDSLMPVGRVLNPGGSTAFQGASIRFNNTTSNQDACKGATVHLLYTANPE